MFTLNWLLLLVKPRQELRALENLERQKGECYCPLIKLEKLSRGKQIKVEEGLFPSYLFINAQSEINDLSYTSIRSSRGVSKIVGFDAEPIKIPQSHIQQLNRREIEGLTCIKVGGLPQTGDKVNIIVGPFKELQATYSHTYCKQIRIVLINLLNQQAPTSLANTQIRKFA
ncbi:MAG: transcriptional antiterminator RfaH [Paraglaciecola sp.]|jgi:transcriptional antiterminator RfaH